MSRTHTTRIESRTPASSVVTPGIAAYGCNAHDAVLFYDQASDLDIGVSIMAEPLGTQNVERAAGYRSISIDHTSRVTGPVLLALQRIGVRFLSTRSVGLDHIDVDYAGSVGITVGNVSYSPHSVADHTLMSMLMAVRDARGSILRTDARDYRLGPRPGRELRDLTVGVVGTGNIGVAVIGRLRGFGCRVVAHDVRPKIATDYVSLDELLGTSDIVTLHAPLTHETRHLLDRDRIARMKNGAIVINTGRGALIDTKALVTALEDGRLGGAALDVIEGEEAFFSTDFRDAPIDNPVLWRLRELSNVTITPHSAFYTEHALRDMVEQSVRSCVAFDQEDAR